jgi:hypothetical protein
MDAVADRDLLEGAAGDPVGHRTHLFLRERTGRTAADDQCGSPDGAELVEPAWIGGVDLPDEGDPGGPVVPERAVRALRHRPVLRERWRWLDEYQWPGAVRPPGGVQVGRGRAHRMTDQDRCSEIVRIEELAQIREYIPSENTYVPTMTLA